MKVSPPKLFWYLVSFVLGLTIFGLKPAPVAAAAMSEQGAWTSQEQALGDGGVMQTVRTKLRGNAASALGETRRSGCGPGYVVARGDTLYAIAVRCGVSLAQLAAANRIRNYNRINAGKYLIIPGIKKSRPHINVKPRQDGTIILPLVKSPYDIDFDSIRPNEPIDDTNKRYIPTPPPGQ